MEAPEPPKIELPTGDQALNYKPMVNTSYSNNSRFLENYIGFNEPIFSLSLFFLVYINCAKGLHLLFPYVHKMHFDQIKAITLIPLLPFSKQLQHVSLFYFYTCL
jgi:hypothetical protein